MILSHRTSMKYVEGFVVRLSPFPRRVNIHEKLYTSVCKTEPMDSICRNALVVSRRSSEAIRILFCNAMHFSHRSTDYLVHGIGMRNHRVHILSCAIVPAFPSDLPFAA